MSEEPLDHRSIPVDVLNPDDELPTVDQLEAMAGGGDIRARGEGYTVYDQIIDEETLQVLAAEAEAVGSAAVVSGWQSDPEYDTDSLKSRYRIVNFIGRTSGALQDQLDELCPKTLEQLHALEQRVGMKVKNAQFNYYEPHSWIRPHRDAYGSEPYAVASVGIGGEGIFAVMPDEQDTEGKTEEFALRPGEVSLLEPINHHGSYTTRVHAARNDSDQPRTVLVVTFEGSN